MKKNQIIIKVPAQQFDIHKFASRSNCYIADELRKMFPNKPISVGINGDAVIDRVVYKNKQHWGKYNVKRAFDQGKGFTVVLERKYTIHSNSDTVIIPGFTGNY